MRKYKNMYYCIIYTLYYFLYCIYTVLFYTVLGIYCIIYTLLSFSENESFKDQRDFSSEVDLMKKLEPHAHVVQLLGCCTLSGIQGFISHNLK